MKCVRKTLSQSDGKALSMIAPGKKHAVFAKQKPSGLNTTSVCFLKLVSELPEGQACSFCTDRAIRG